MHVFIYASECDLSASVYLQRNIVSIERLFNCWARMSRVRDFVARSLVC
jgi:hypothetical protein